jgi:tRNA 2-thiouridine synthesizing protein A
MVGQQDIVVVDARGLSCPQPVIRTRAAIADLQTGVVEVLVDTGPQRDNVSRVARKEGWEVSVTETIEGEFQVRLRK